MFLGPRLGTPTPSVLGPRRGRYTRSASLREGGRTTPAVERPAEPPEFAWTGHRSGYRAEINWQNGKVQLMDKVSLLAGGWWIIFGLVSSVGLLTWSIFDVSSILQDWNHSSLLVFRLFR